MHRDNRLQRGIRLFEHPLLDWGSRVHPVLPALFWGPISLIAIGWGVWAGVRGWYAIALLVTGYFSWTVTEYFLHRWFFHFRPPTAWMRRWFYYVHEHHHRYQERDRLLAPPLMSLPIGAVLLGLLYLTVGRTLGLAEMWVLGGAFAIGYLVYDYTHLYLHFAQPKSRWGKYLRRCHFEHHFVQPDRWFCISFPWLDYLFGTHSRKSASPRAASRWRKQIAVSEVDDDSLPRMVREYEASRATTRH